MSILQLFFALATLFITVLLGQVVMIKWYIDARFTSIDNQLKFIIDHTISQGERIATLEGKAK